MCNHESCERSCACEYVIMQVGKHISMEAGMHEGTYACRTHMHVSVQFCTHMHVSVYAFNDASM